MATQKRRVIYLSDQQWTAATERAKAFNISISAYIAGTLHWASLIDLREVHAK